MKNLQYSRKQKQFALLMCMSFACMLWANKSFAHSFSYLTYEKLDTAFSVPPIEDSTLEWEMAISGKRTRDSLVKYVMNGETSRAINRHCNNDFLFVTYVGDTDQFTGTYNLEQAQRLSHGVPLRMWMGWSLWDDTGKVFPLAPYLGYSILEKQVLNWVWERAGYFTIKFDNLYYIDSVTHLPMYTITARVLVLNREQKLNINFEKELCITTSNLDSDYRFKVIMDPPLHVICPVKPRTHIEWDKTVCANKADLNMNLSFAIALPTSDSIPVHNSDSGMLSFTNRFPLGGGTYGLYGVFNQCWPSGTFPWGAEQNYFIKHADIAKFLNVGDRPIRGSVNFNDGYKTSCTSNLFLPVLSPANASNYNNEGGYKIIEYNKTLAHVPSSLPYGTVLSPNYEIWTPTNNPMTLEGWSDSTSLIRIKQSIIIGKGQRLTIKDMRVEMGKDAQIIVQSDSVGNTEAGVLILENSTISATQTCGNENYTWKGIILEGNSGKNQDPIAGDFLKRNQAMLYMSNSSVIENAVVAVQTFDPNNPVIRSGGIVYASNSSFINNQLALNFSAYPIPPLKSKTYSSVINNCAFLANDNNLLSSFKGFVEGYGVNGLQFNSCSFIADYGAKLIGFGIKGIDLGLQVRGNVSGTKPCYFQGLYEGIRIDKARLGDMGSGLNVIRSKFVYNYTGIHSAGVLNTYTCYNTFLMPVRPSLSTAIRNTTGINIETGSGFTLTNNIFGPLSSATNTLITHNNAVLIWNSGSSDNYVQRNTVSSLQQGMISNFQNKMVLAPGNSAHGLQFLCNQQDANVSTCIAALGANPAIDGISPSQGTLSMPAGNTFGHVKYDIYNPNTQVGTVTYYYGSGSNSNPTANFGSVYKINSSFNDNCPSSLAPLDTTMHPLPLTALSGMDLREALMWNVAFYSQAYDSLNRNERLHNYLGMLDDAYSDLARVELYVSDGDTIAANNLYNSIVTNRSLTGTEAEEFSHWGRKLLDISIDRRTFPLQELSASEVACLSTIADSAQMWAKVRAQNWLHAYDGRNYLNVFLYPEDGINTMRKLLVEDSGQVSDEIVFPNPTAQYLSIRYQQQSNNGTKAVLEIRDLMGHLVRQQVLATDGLQQIDIADLPNATYLYRISELGATKKIGKLVKK